MGWLYGHDWHTAKAARDAFKSHMTASGRLTILDEATTCYGRHYYALVQPTNADGSKAPSFIVLALLDKNGKETWGYKDMDESMGPFHYDCPVKLIHAADPPANDTAKQWRATVLTHAETVAVQRAKAAGLHVGDTVYLREGVKPRGPFTVCSTKPLRGFYGNVLYRLKPSDVDSVTPKGSPDAPKAIDTPSA